MEKINQLDKHFLTIITDQLNESHVGNGLSNGNLIEKIKPFMFDSLKRYNRLTGIISSILTYANTNDEQWGFMSLIEDRSLLSALIQTVNKSSRAKLGTLIVKNDYPVPLLFSKYNNLSNECSSNNKVENELCFELLDSELCRTYKPLAVVSGSSSACFRGKTTLIPFLFEGLHPEYSVLRSTVKHECLQNNVDVLCNDETSSKWVIADFHSIVQSNKAKNLLKAMLKFASFHLLNVTLDDFDNKTGSMSYELTEVFEWHKTHTSSVVILLIRDYTSTAKSKLEMIREKLSQKNNTRIHLMTLENISNKEDSNRAFRIGKIVNRLNEIIESRDFILKPMHSIYDVQKVFSQLENNLNVNANVETSKRLVETHFDKLFKVIFYLFLIYFILYS